MTHSEKINESGEMYITSSCGVTCYDLYTFARKYRWGKIYNTDKQYIILAGSCELTQEIGWKDTIQSITADNGIFTILSWIPHIFYFPEDTRMIEWFPAWSTSTDFERYREMK